jgi:hypothetical protein
MIAAKTFIVKAHCYLRPLEAGYLTNTSGSVNPAGNHLTAHGIRIDARRAQQYLEKAERAVGPRSPPENRRDGSRMKQCFCCRLCSGYIQPL